MLLLSRAALFEAAADALAVETDRRMSNSMPVLLWSVPYSRMVFMISLVSFWFSF